MSHERGFTLLEVLFAILILTIVITTSLSIVYGREKRLKEARQMMQAHQLISNEVEIIRHTPYEQLSTEGSRPFTGDPQLLAQLPGSKATFTVEQTREFFKTVTLDVTWQGGVHHATLSVIRSNTGAANSLFQ